MKVDIMKLVDKAIKTDSLKDLLVGNKNFNVPNQSGFITDKDVVLYGGIYGYYKKNPTSNINIKYENTLIEMLDGNLFELLNSFDYAFMQILSETMGIAPFKLNAEFYIKLKQKVELNKDVLKHYKEYVQYGANLSNGAYEYLENLNQYCEDNYGHKII